MSLCLKSNSCTPPIRSQSDSISLALQPQHTKLLGQVELTNDIKQTKGQRPSKAVTKEWSGRIR